MTLYKLKDLCDNEGIHKYTQIKLFVKNNANINITTEYNKLVDNKIYNETLENMLILKIYRQLKSMNTIYKNYKTLCNNNKKVYNDYIWNEETEYLVNNNITNNKSTILCKLMTPYKINCELLTYELLYYTPYNKLYLGMEVLHKIKLIFDKYNILIHKYVEDNYWILNFKDTHNFNVCKNTVILSNTLKTKYEDCIVDHMNKLINYINRLYKLTSIQYKITEDNKYDFSWVLVSINYIE